MDQHVEHVRSLAGEGVLELHAETRGRTTAGALEALYRVSAYPIRRGTVDPKRIVPGLGRASE